MRVRITPEMLHEAEAYQTDVVEHIPKYANPSGLEAENRYRNGRLGELCFAEACRQHGVSVEYLGNALGVSDEGRDYRIGMETIDAKYVPHNGWRFMQNVIEHARKQTTPTYYVPVQVTKGLTLGTIRGYFTAKDVSEMPIEQGNHGAPFYSRRLWHARPLSELLERWAPRQVALL